MDKKKQKPPVWLLLIVFITLFSLISIGITLVFHLPWVIPIPILWGIIMGVILLIIGFFFLINALRALTLRRAFGKEIYVSKTESQLITTGIYSYSRNPLYFGAILAFFGWFFVFLFTFLLILSFLFTILFYFVAKWEEHELSERFGDDYTNYKTTVPFFIPHLKKRKGEKIE